MFAEMVKGVGEHDTIGRHHVHCACVCGGGVECEVGGVCECLSTTSKCTEHDPPLCVWGVECEVGGVGGVCECLSTTSKCTEHDPPTLMVLRLGLGLVLSL